MKDRPNPVRIRGPNLRPIGGMLAIHSTAVLLRLPHLDSFLNRQMQADLRECVQLPG
jgi:hypothetical protein